MEDFSNEEYECLGYFMLKLFHKRFFDNTITADILETEFQAFLNDDENAFSAIEGSLIDCLIAYKFISVRSNSTIKFNTRTIQTFRNELIDVLEGYQRYCRVEKKENVVFEEYAEGTAELLPGSKIVKLISNREFSLRKEDSTSSESDETDYSSSDDDSHPLPQTIYLDNLILKCQICKNYELLHFDVTPKFNIKAEVQEVIVCREVSDEGAEAKKYVKTVSILRHKLPLAIEKGFKFVIRNNLFEILTYGKINVMVTYKWYDNHEEKRIRENHTMKEVDLLKPFHCLKKSDLGPHNIPVYPSFRVELYCTPGNLREIAWEPKFLEYMTRSRTVTPSNFCVVFRNLLEMEDMASINLYKRFVQQKVQVQRDLNKENELQKRGELEDKFAYTFTLISKRKKYFAAMDAITAGDHVILLDWRSSHFLEHQYCITTGIDILKNKHLYQRDTNIRLIMSRIEDVTNRGVVFLLPRNREFSLKIQYVVHFVPQRESFLIQYKALENLTKDPHLMSLLFPTGRSADGDVDGLNLELYNESIYSNPEQYEGVKRIVSKRNSTIPYIIYGPPGTGKTTTLVEAVLQLWKASKDNFILIVGGSNACCDEIGIRLTKTFMDIDRYGRNMLRLFSKSARKNYLDEGTKSLNPILKAMSNFCHEQHFYPEPIQLESYKVVVSTLAVIGRYASRLGKLFTHVFIDECGASTETEVAAALSGLISKKTVVVLAGDPKQLGPVVKGDEARRHGFEVSALERILKTDCYHFNETTLTYDQTIQIRLVRNFRTHPKILHMSNHLYYNNQLQYMADERITKWAERYYDLPTPQFPLILHAVDGTCSQRPDGTSYCNEEEIEIVIKYVKELMFFGVSGQGLKESDIGVISPYKYQVSRIKAELKKLNWLKIEVGPVEVFQGQEKPIIIFSTVRSGGKNIGFVSSPKRINVSLTRAQALLIIVGNPITLRANNGFDYIVDYCTRVGAKKENYENLTNEQLLEKIRCLFVYTRSRLRG